MSNQFDVMREAVYQANITIRAADNVASQMGSMLVGRLRHCSQGDLNRLKKELKKYNIHTGQWRD